MTEPERLSPDPSVALAAWRFPSETKADTFHDVALMLCEVPAECDATAVGHIEALQGGARVVCRACARVLRWWGCDCEDATYRDRPCKHITRARALYAAERRTARGGE